MNYLIIAALILIIVAIILIANRKKNTKTDIVFVPSSISDTRVANLKLKQTPDIELGILDEKKIKFPQKLESKESDDYRGIPELEWIVDIIPPKDFHFTKDKFLEVFDYDWRTNFDSECYAYFPITKRWSFAISGDSPEQFDSLELAVNLAPRFEDKELTVEKLKLYLDELNKRLSSFDAKMEVVPRESLESAVQRSVSLRQLQNDSNIDIIIVLQSDSKFKSKDFWNTMIDLGLKWGDGDVFHWTNYDSGIGDDNLFSVWTTSEPGYFLPEDISKGKVKPSDLVFGFSIPRSPDPIGVYEILIESVEYCQSKLGGKILDENGMPFDKEKYKKRIDELIKKMSEYGFKQGQGLILRLI